MAENCYKLKALQLAADFGTAKTKSELLRLGHRAQTLLVFMVKKIDSLEKQK
jgi:hypothetical protein